jgi:hypothetical protein
VPRLATILLRLLIAVAVLLLVSFAADALVFRLRGSPAASVMVHPYLAVPKKNAGLEFMFQEPREQACVSAVFPHAGQVPCWYLRRHTEQRTNL